MISLNSLYSSNGPNHSVMELKLSSRLSNRRKLLRPPERLQWRLKQDTKPPRDQSAKLSKMDLTLSMPNPLSLLLTELIRFQNLKSVIETRPWLSRRTTTPMRRSTSNSMSSLADKTKETLAQALLELEEDSPSWVEDEQPNWLSEKLENFSLSFHCSRVGLKSI